MKTLNHNLKPYAWLLALIIATIVAILLTGCYPVKKAEKQTDKAYSHYPAMVAGKTRAWFPCVTKDSTVTFDTTKVNDSSGYFRAKADSLLKVKQRIVTENEIRAMKRATTMAKPNRKKIPFSKSLIKVLKTAARFLLPRQKLKTFKKKTPHSIK